MKKILIFLSILLFIKNSDINLEQIRADILSNHNEHRKAHQVEPLTRDSEIEKVAQAYSEYLASISQMVHSNNELYGENLYYCLVIKYASQEMKLQKIGTKKYQCMIIIIQDFL